MNRSLYDDIFVIGKILTENACDRILEIPFAIVNRFQYGQFGYAYQSHFRPIVKSSESSSRNGRVPMGF